MQGRGLLTLLIAISVSFGAYAQDDFDTSEFDAPTAEGLDSPIAEPDPSSVLSPKANTSASDEFSDFEDSGGATETKAKQEAPTALDEAPASTLETPKVETPAPLPIAEPSPPEAPDVLSNIKPDEKKPTVQAEPLIQKQSSEVDEPDFATEERLYRIYQKYNSQPTSDISWGKALSDGKAQVYDVQNGDTLWDISQTLFGDSQYWPKVWSINNETFPNPHEITPSTKIQFFAGGLTEPPALAISGAEKPIVVEAPLAKNEITPDVVNPTTSSDFPLAEFPKPSRNSRRLKIIPESLPIYRIGAISKQSSKVEIVNARKVINEPLVSLSHYVVERGVSAVGKVIETERGGNTASQFQHVILELNNYEGNVFHTVTESDIVKNSNIKSEIRGKMVEVQGEVEVLEKVNEEKNYYRAIVKKAILPVTVGSQVLSGPLPIVDVIPGVPESTIKATLIGGQFSANRVLYPRFSFVFVDLGITGGLREGQTLSVFANPKNRNERTVEQFHQRVIGKVKIIKISDNFSTAYVVEAFEDLRMGDFVGGGSIQTPVEKAAAETAEKPSIETKEEESAEQLDL